MTAGTAATPRSPAPETYTPKHLAEKILTSRVALEGERKQVTVLFADMKGSMELLADRDPEDARKLLDPVLERMMEAVHRYEGTVNQVMGDGIMALFGAPVAHEDHAVRACYAALRMQEAVQRYAEGVRRSEGFLVQIRVGLNSGEVVVRSIGSDLHMDYAAVGQTTHLAARLEQLAAPGTALMSAEALRLAEGYVQVKPVGPVNYETSLFPEIEYTFKHALTHEVTYGSVLQSKRRELHARIVEAIERLHADRLAGHVDRLAHHAVRAEAWDKALTYLRQAAAKAADRLALRPAAAYLEQAVAAADRLPRRRDVLEQSIDLHTDLRAVLFPLNEYDSLSDHLSQAAALAGEIGDDLRLGRIAAMQAHYHCIVVGDMVQALECARRATAIADRVGAPGLVGAARFTLGQVHHGGGQYLEAIAALEANVELLQGELAHERGPLAAPIALLSRVWLAFALAEVGRFAEAITNGVKAVQQAEALNHLYSLYHAHWALAAVRLGQGQHERAVEAAAELRRIASEADVQQMLDNGSGLLGHAHALAGRVGDGLALLEDMPIAGRNAHTGHRDVFYLADAYLRSGRLDDALRTARQALDLARTSHEHGREAHALRLLGDIQAARGDNSEAEQLYRDALTRGTGLGMHPLVAHGHLGLGKLCRRTGKREQAQEHLGTATAMYREMDMRFWLEQAEAELAALP